MCFSSEMVTAWSVRGRHDGRMRANYTEARDCLPDRPISWVRETFREPQITSSGIPDRLWLFGRLVGVAVEDIEPYW